MIAAPSFPRRRESSMLRSPQSVRAEVSKPCACAVSRNRFFLLPAGESGCRPDSRPSFLCLPKEKKAKERAPSSPVALGATALRCSVFAGRAELTTRPAGAAFKQASRSQMWMRAARAPAKPCAARRLRRGPKSNAVVASQRSLSTRDTSRLRGNDGAA